MRLCNFKPVVSVLLFAALVFAIQAATQEIPQQTLRGTTSTRSMT